MKTQKLLMARDITQDCKMAGDWTESYAVLGPPRDSRGCRVKVEKSKLEEIGRSPEARSSARGVSLSGVSGSVGSEIGANGAVSGVSSETCETELRRSRFERPNDSELVRWNSFYDLKRVWWEKSVQICCISSVPTKKYSRLNSGAHCRRTQYKPSKDCIT